MSEKMKADRDEHEHWKLEYKWISSNGFSRVKKTEI